MPHVLLWQLVSTYTILVVLLYRVIRQMNTSVHPQSRIVAYQEVQTPDIT